MISSASRLLSGIIPADAGSTRPAGPDPRGWLDHPRGCGEHFYGSHRGSDRQGSSPRMRGAPFELGGAACRTGIIPADAGSTATLNIRHSKIEDHPRGCGEHFTDTGGSQNLKGSSPRMRGAHIYCRLTWGSCRIIPADAGSTRLACAGSRSSRDHPRGCGEHCWCGGRPLLHVGSSPRMRGAPHPHRIPSGLAGIIPADAGSTSSSRCCCIVLWDHPRGCGEHLFVKADYQHAMRIIPADAGSTQFIQFRLARTWDHPRGCGEHNVGNAMTIAPLGSSPRMRGALLQKDIDCLPAEIIPADAGSTSSLQRAPAAPMDHPRGCGEHTIKAVYVMPIRGSSPRMRGALNCVRIAA